MKRLAALFIEHLSGSGILLYPNLDPGGLLANHFLIVESDEGKRRLGKILDDLVKDDVVNLAIGALIDAAAVTQPLLGGLMKALVSQVPGILKKNKDDILFAHNHSGFDFDDYGLRPNENPSDFEVGNDRAFCTLRVRTRS